MRQRISCGRAATALLVLAAGLLAWPRAGAAQTVVSGATDVVGTATDAVAATTDAVAGAVGSAPAPPALTVTLPSVPLLP